MDTRNQEFSIQLKGTHHKKFVPSRRMSQNLTNVRVELATTDVQKIKYQQLVRSSWRIKTMILPEQSQTMAYTMHKTGQQTCV